MNKRLKASLAILITGILVAGLALYIDYRHFLASPLAVPEQGMTLTVAPGTSIAGVAQRLEQQGVVSSSGYLRAYARLHGLASRIQVGEYAIVPGTTPPALMEQLVIGRVIQYSLTVVEGWTFRQMLQAIASHPKLEHTLQGLSDTEIIARLGHPGEHPEGRFFPDTYYFPAGTSDLDFLRRAFDALEQRLTAAWEQRAPGLPLESPYEALILASIIEKETGVPSERREIAGVFIRRLQKGMRLQTDPTVIYGLDRAFDGIIRRSDLLTDTFYNTYTRNGLPPTPIALPGAASLMAAVNPAPGETLYFVATGNGDGSHVFSTTLQEHNRAVQEYRLKMSTP
jgi:UPF0755 protein